MAQFIKLSNGNVEYTDNLSNKYSIPSIAVISKKAEETEILKIDIPGGLSFKIKQSEVTLPASSDIDDLMNKLATDFFFKASATGTGAVNSVFGRDGDVVPVTNDYSKEQISGLKTTDEPSFAGLNIQGKHIIKRTNVSDATYSLALTDYILHVTRTETGNCSITIPSVQITLGRKVVIVDAGGKAGTNNIILETEGTEKINGQSNYIINIDNEAVILYSDGNNLFISSKNNPKNILESNMGEFKLNGATIYNNIGAGYEISLDAGQDDEILWDRCLKEEYKGEILNPAFCFVLYSSSPVGKSIKIEIDYTYLWEGREVDPYIQKDGTITEIIDTNELTANRPIIHVFSSQIPANQNNPTCIMLTIRRAGTDTEDTYLNTIDIYSFGLLKFKN